MKTRNQSRLHLAGAADVVCLLPVPLGQCVRPLGPADPNVPYRLRDFVDDQRRVLACGPGRGAVFHDRWHDADGTLSVIHVGVLRSALAHEPAARNAFLDKYGVTGDSRLRRFEAVIDFLADWHGPILESGLATGGMPLSIRDEFLRYLLSYRLTSAACGIPGSALTWYRYHWEHRWI